MSDVVQFPLPPIQTGTPEDNKIDAELQQLRNAQNILKDVTEKRKKSVEKLGDIVDQLDDSDRMNADHMQPAYLEVLRDVRRGISETLTALEAHDRLLDMITNDLVGIVDNGEQHAEATQRNTIVLQSLIVGLMDKGALTTEEFKAAQTKVITEMQQAMEKKRK